MTEVYKGQWKSIEVDRYLYKLTRLTEGDRGSKKLMVVDKG